VADLIRSQAGLVFITIVVVFAAWGGVIEGGYVSDDWAWLERAAEGTVLREGKFLRPVCWLTWLITPLRHPSFSHTLDLFVHWMCAYVVGLLVVSLGGSWLAGVGAGIIFASAPTLHEAICWSSARCGPFAMCLILMAVNLVIQGNRRIAVPLIIVALGFKEPAIFALWGIPIILMAGKNTRDAIRWFGICTLLFVLYVIVVRLTGSFENLGGGYAVSLDIHRSLNHLGAYTGKLVGVSGTQWLWPLWIILGIASIIPFTRGIRLPFALWLWQIILFLPFIRLGGPEQARFLYPLSVLPIVSVVLIADRLTRNQYRIRVALSVFIIGLIGIAIVHARRVSDDWLKASRLSEVVIQKSLRRLEIDRPHVVIDPPEFVGKAHVFRNGLFESLRLVSGNRLYRGVSIAPSEKITTRGELQDWLETRAPDLMKNRQTSAWLFQDNRPLQLRGWRLNERMDEPLEQLVIVR